MLSSVLSYCHSRMILLVWSTFGLPLARWFQLRGADISPAALPPKSTCGEGIEERRPGRKPTEAHGPFDGHCCGAVRYLDEPEREVGADVLAGEHVHRQLATGNMADLILGQRRQHQS